MQALKELLWQKYQLKAAAITPAKRGFYGETWRVQAGVCAYFVKLDCWDAHKQQFCESLPVVQWLKEQGLHFVVAPIKTKTGQLWCSFQGGVLAVFPFVQGENREDYPLSRLFTCLKQVYALDAASLPLVRDTFDDSAVYKTEALRQKIANELPEYALPLQALFAKHQAVLAYYAKRLRLFAAICMQKPAPLCLTHGDAGGNCILTKESFTIIDWDQPRLAPIERDTWVFMQDAGLPRWEQIRQIEAVLAPITLDKDYMCFYCYSMFFTYIGEYCSAILQPDYCKQGREKILADLAGYFHSWILQPLAVADTIRPTAE